MGLFSFGTVKKNISIIKMFLSQEPEFCSIDTCCAILSCVMPSQIPVFLDLKVNEASRK